jgi:hypothetical protein
MIGFNENKVETLCGTLPLNSRSIESSFTNIPNLGSGTPVPLNCSLVILAGGGAGSNAPRCEYKSGIRRPYFGNLPNAKAIMMLATLFTAGLVVLASAQSTFPNASVSILQVYPIRDGALIDRPSPYTPSFLPLQSSSLDLW